MGEGEPATRPVVLVGSANMDLVAYAARLPREGETVLAERLSQSPGGKGANQAVAAARAGARTVFAGAVGDDHFGDALLAALQEAGVEVQHVARRSGVSTGLALITVDTAGRNLITVVPGANGLVDEAAAETVAGELAPGAVAVAQLEVPL